MIFFSVSDDRQRNTVFQTKFPNNEPRPHFTSKIENVTVNVGREAILECHVNNLGRYKVNISLFFSPGVHGGLYNLSYWDSGIRGWLEDRSPPGGLLVPL